MSWHTFPHKFHGTYLRLLHADWATQASTLALVVIALVFLVVGMARWVEFLDFGFSKMRRSILIVIHLVGCLVLAMAFAVQAVDLDKQFSNIGMGLLASALVLLFPIHIYLGLLRRIRTRANPPTILIPKWMSKWRFWK